MLCNWTNLAPRPDNWYDFAYWTSESRWLQWNELCRLDIDGKSDQTTNAYASKLTTRLNIHGSASSSTTIGEAALSLKAIVSSGINQTSHIEKANARLRVSFRAFLNQETIVDTDISLQIPIDADSYQDTYIFSEVSIRIVISSTGATQLTESEAYISIQNPLYSTTSEQHSHSSTDLSVVLAIDTSVYQETHTDSDVSSSEALEAVLTQDTYSSSDLSQDDPASGSSSQETFITATLDDNINEDLGGGCAQVQYIPKAELTFSGQEEVLDGVSNQSSYSSAILVSAPAEEIEGTSSQVMDVTSDLGGFTPEIIEATTSAQTTYIQSVLDEWSAETLISTPCETTSVFASLGDYEELFISATITQFSFVYGEVQTNELKADITQTTDNNFCTLDYCGSVTTEIFTLEGDPAPTEVLLSGVYDVWAELVEINWLTGINLVGAPIWVQEVEDPWWTEAESICVVEVIGIIQQTSNVTPPTFILQSPLDSVISQYSYIDADLNFVFEPLGSQVLQSTSVFATFPATDLSSDVPQENYISVAILDTEGPFSSELSEVTSSYSELTLAPAELGSAIVNQEQHVDIAILTTGYIGVEATTWQATYSFASLGSTDVFISASTGQNTFCLANIFSPFYLDAEIIQNTHLDYAVLQPSVTLEASGGQLSLVSADFVEREGLGDADASQTTTTLAEIESKTKLESVSNQVTFADQIILSSYDVLISACSQNTYTLGTLGETQLLVSNITQTTFPIAGVEVETQTIINSTIDQFTFTFASLSNNLIYLSAERTQFTYVDVVLINNEFIGSAVSQNADVFAVLGWFEYIDTNVSQVTFSNSPVLSETKYIIAETTQVSWSSTDVNIKIPFSSETDQVTFVSSLLSLREGISSILYQNTRVPVAFLNVPGGLTSLYSTQLSYVYAQTTLTSYLFSTAAAQSTDIVAGLSTPGLLYGTGENETYNTAILISNVSLYSIIIQHSDSFSRLDSLIYIETGVSQDQYISNAELDLGASMQATAAQYSFAYAIELFTFVYPESSVTEITSVFGRMNQESFLSTIIIQSTSNISHIVFREDCSSDIIQIQSVFGQLEWGSLLAAQTEQRTSSVGYIRATTIGFVLCPAVQIYEGLTQQIELYIGNNSFEIEVVDDGHDLKIEIYVQSDFFEQPCDKSIEVYSDGYALKIEIYQDNSPLNIEIYDDGHDLKIINYSCE
jgi:hypothetical protein